MRNLIPNTLKVGDVTTVSVYTGDPTILDPSLSTTDSVDMSVAFVSQSTVILEEVSSGKRWRFFQDKYGGQKGNTFIKTLGSNVLYIAPANYTRGVW
jgi:hypothetical protein